MCKRRAQFTVDVAFAAGGGEACGLFGASGAGKSTILACIAGAESPDAGVVKLDDVTLFPPALPLHRRRIGYLTQDANLFPHLRVADNVRFGLTNGARADGDAWIAHSSSTRFGMRRRSRFRVVKRAALRLRACSPGGRV